MAIQDMKIVLGEEMEQEIQIRVSIGLLTPLRKEQVASQVVAEFLKDKFGGVEVHDADENKMVCTIITSAKANLSAEFIQQDVKSQIEHTMIHGVDIVGYKEEAEIYGNV